MPHYPERLTITNVSADVINAIRNSGSINYRDYLPIVTPDADSIRAFGAILMDAPNLRNSFAADLLNMVIAVHVASKSYESPTARLKKGMLEHGETIEDIFVSMLEAELYDPAGAEADVFKRRFPDIKAAFYVTNYKVKYPVTIANEDLRAAFYNADGVYNLINRIEEQLYTSDAYDDFNMVKYMIARHIVQGHIKRVGIAATDTPDNIRAGVRVIKSTSNQMRFMTDQYTIAGVTTHAQHDEQTLLMSADYDAAVDVEVLAAAFHMDKAEFLSKRLMIDSFGNIDIRRLAACAPEECENIVYETLPNGITRVVSADLRYITAAQLAALKTVPAVLIDDNFVQEYDVLNTVEEIRNPSGLYTNAFHHVWRKYAVSPFAPAAVFDVSGAGAVTDVSVSPAAASVAPDGELHFVADVTATGFASQAVTWTVTGATSTDTRIDEAGNLHVGADETAGTLTVTATAASDNAVSGSASVNVVGIPHALTAAGDYIVEFNPVGPQIAGTTIAARLPDAGAVEDYSISIATPGTIRPVPFAASVGPSGLVITFIMPNGPVTVTINDAVSAVKPGTRSTKGTTNTNK